MATTCDEVALRFTISLVAYHMPRSVLRVLRLLGLLGLSAAFSACRADRAKGHPSYTASSQEPSTAVSTSASPGLRPYDVAPISDARLTNAIENSLTSDPVLRPHAIQVSVADGVVSLAGRVGTLATDRRAKQLVADFKGVRSIVDRIQVDAPARPDAEIAREVRDALALDPATRTAKVRATASGQMLTLSGTVDSSSQRDLVDEIAAHVPGVRKVNLTVTVAGNPVPSDNEVAAAVTDRIQEDARLDGTTIRATAQGGITVLSGVVGSLAQRDAAVQDAQAAGAGNVDAQPLLIEWRALTGPRSSAARPLSTDEEIAGAVRRWLSTDAIVGAELPNVRVERGVVTLSGNVEDFRAARAARRDTRRVSGVWEVRDQMTVLPARREGDAAIQSLVMQSIFENGAAPDARNVHVTAVHAKVSLEGKVATPEDRRVIEDDAERVPGVVSVDDHLRVQGYGPKTLPVSADALRHRLIEALFWDPRVPDGKVTVHTAANGDVTLAGIVDTWGQARVAGDDALRAGAAHVVNDIRVAGRSP